MLKDFMKSFFLEEESTLVDETPVQVDEPSIMSFPEVKTQPSQPKPKAASTFLSVDEPRSHRVKVKRKPVQEGSDYQAVLSPLFGNTKAAFDKVHNAVELPEVKEAVEFVQVVSPIYGQQKRRHMPQEESFTNSVVLADMLEQPDKKETLQKPLFDKKG